MNEMMNFPTLILALSLVVLWLAARLGAFYAKRHGVLRGEDHQDFDVVEAGALTLLALIIGFSFSLAASRYEQRKNYEEAEANAIGTEYVRASLLPPADAEKVRALLRSYLDHRILFYTTRNEGELRRIDAATAQLQTDLWSAIQTPAATQPTPIMSLVVWGMNDVLNSQGYTQAAWWNRIPTAAWALMAAIAICCNLLIGYNVRRVETKPVFFFILPLVVSISFFLIADIDTPRRGVIRVHPQNLESLSQSLQPR